MGIPWGLPQVFPWVWDVYGDYNPVPHGSHVNKPGSATGWHWHVDHRIAVLYIAGCTHYPVN